MDYTGKLYFAHPINTYNTHWEKEVLRLAAIFISRKFEGVENPNHPNHGKAYFEWKKKYGNGMRYFYEEVLPKCGGVMALPFLDGKLGAGVAGEVIWMMKEERPIFLVDIRGQKELIGLRFFSAEERNLLEVWNSRKLFAPDEEEESVGNELVLSIADTRKRTWEVLYKKQLPYGRAHLIG